MSTFFYLIRLGLYHTCKVASLGGDSEVWIFKIVLARLFLQYLQVTLGGDSECGVSRG
jgi:hypothetical protein